jgi:GT2 family glycosyltransferase
VKLVPLDLGELANPTSGALDGQQALVEVTDGDEVVASCFVSEADPSAQRDEIVRHLSQDWQARRVAGAVGDPSSWRRSSEEEPAEPMTVVVCTASRPAQLARCLGSVLPQLRDADELLVIDNSRAGSARQVAARADARWVHETRPGSSWARNRGFQEADHGLIAYIDDDCVADRSWLASVRRPFGIGDVDAVTTAVLARRADLAVPLLVDDRYPYFRGWETKRFTGSTWTPDSPFDAWRLGTGASMAWRRTTLEALGGFDPALGAGTPVGSGDELDLLRRALATGATVVYEPQALVYHDHPETMRALRRTLIRYALGAGARAAKTLSEERQLRPVRLLARDWRWNLRQAPVEACRFALGRPHMPVTGLVAQPAAAAVGAFRFFRHRDELRAAPL